MTWFVSFRSQDVGGPVVRSPDVVASEAVEKPTYTLVAPLVVERAVVNRRVILAIHGFNVSRPKGVRSLSRLEAALAPGADEIFFGVLWPGDWWAPVINYPAEASDAVAAGQALARFVNEQLRGAESVSLISHSLGGRVLLEALAGLERPARSVCIGAGAVDNDCLQGQYKTSTSQARRLSVLASERDKVLKLAYPLGDFASDFLWRDNGSPWRGALGLKGPRTALPNPPVSHRQIHRDDNYDHGDYFPPSAWPEPASKPGDPAPRWREAAAYMRRCIDGAPDSWSRRPPK